MRRPIVLTGTLVASTLGLLTLAAPARADTVELAASSDTTLYEENTDFGNGAGDYLFIGRNGGGSLRRTLIAFDVAGSLPPGATINTVALTLHISRGRGEEPHPV